MCSSLSLLDPPPVAKHWRMCACAGETTVFNSLQTSYRASQPLQVQHSSHHEARPLRAAGKCLPPLLLECMVRVEVQVHGCLIRLISAQHEGDPLAWLNKSCHENCAAPCSRWILSMSC